MLYDLIIIGGSAAATTAGIYAARRNLNFKIVTKEFGGEVATSGEIGNWPGASQTDGIALSQQFREHLAFYKVEPEEGVWIEKITKLPDGNFAITGKKEEASITYQSKTVIIATGVHPKALGIPGEKEFRNKGVTYCTVCDGPIFAGKVVATIGGGNSALESALMLAGIASQVFVINKNSAFRGEQVLIDKLAAQTNVKVIFDARTTAIVGKEFVNELKYQLAGGEEKALPVEGVFVHIGMTPNSQLVPEETARNQFGEIVVDKDCATNIPGLYAAGDVTDVPHKQIVIAAGMGCIAVLSVVDYLNKLK